MSRRVEISSQPFDNIDEVNEDRRLMGECIIPLAGTARQFPVHFYGEMKLPPAPEGVASYDSLDEIGLRVGINSEPEEWLKPVIQALYDTDLEAQKRDEDETLMHVLLTHPDKHERDIARRDSFHAVLMCLGEDAVDEGSLEKGRTFLRARLRQVDYEGMFDHVLTWAQRNAATLVASERAQLSSGHANENLRKSMTHVRSMPKVKRNDPCPCGSGKKFKKCCGRAG